MAKAGRGWIVTGWLMIFMGVGLIALSNVVGNNSKNAPAGGDKKIMKNIKSDINNSKPSSDKGPKKNADSKMSNKELSKIFAQGAAGWILFGIPILIWGLLKRLFSRQN